MWHIALLIKGASISTFSYKTGSINLLKVIEAIRGLKSSSRYTEVIMAQQSGNDLKPPLEKLLQAFDDEDDRDLLHRTELDHIFRILRANKEKITSLPPDVEKKEELPELLRKD